jgi:2-dehydro-3-deoxygluconokinase
LGGSVAYVSFAARLLDARASVVSKVGSDFPNAYLWWLRQQGVDASQVIRVENARTTRFELKYDEDLSNRTLRLKDKAPPISVDELPKSLKARAIHVAPIANEIDYELVEKLKSCADVLSFDPQGLVRRFDENGNISMQPLADSRILRSVDIYRSSWEEIRAITGLSEINSAIEAVREHGIDVVIVTLGAKGALVSVENKIHSVPTCKSIRVVDPTGAGDSFIGAFLAEYVHGEDCSWCASVGSAAASLVVEGVGPTYFGDSGEVYRRAQELYEKEIKG